MQTDYLVACANHLGQITIHQTVSCLRVSIPLKPFYIQCMTPDALRKIQSHDALCSSESRRELRSSLRQGMNAEGSTRDTHTLADSECPASVPCPVKRLCSVGVGRGCAKTAVRLTSLSLLAGTQRSCSEHRK